MGGIDRRWETSEHGGGQLFRGGLLRLGDGVAPTAVGVTHWILPILLTQDPNKSMFVVSMPTSFRN